MRFVWGLCRVYIGFIIGFVYRGYRAYRVRIWGL